MSKINSSLSDGIASGETLLAVPFAGTGTTGFEACCRAMNVAPSVTRGHYGCEDFVFHPAATMASIRKRLMALVKVGGAPQMVFGDTNHDVVKVFDSEAKAFCLATGLVLNIAMEDNDFLEHPEALFRNVGGASIAGRTVFLPLNPLVPTICIQ